MSHPDLGRSIRSLAAKVAAIRPPENLEASLLAEFDRAHSNRKAPSRHVRFLTVGSALAASLLAGALLLRPEPGAPTAATARSQESANSQDFFPIPYTPPLQPYERVLVVQTEVPVSQLIAAGFRVQTSDPGGSVKADVMVSQDGRPRAIRPVVYSVSDRR